MFTSTPCFEVHYNLRILASTIILALQMRKLRLMLIQSLVWAPMISDRAETIKPRSSDSYSVYSSVASHSVVSKRMNE